MRFSVFLIPSHLTSILQQEYSTDVDAVDSLTTMKLLLKQAWPHLLAKRIKADDDIVPSGCVHVIGTSPGKGLVWNTLTKSKVNEEVVFLKSEDIDELKICSLFTVSQITHSHLIHFPTSLAPLSPSCCLLSLSLSLSPQPPPSHGVLWNALPLSARQQQTDLRA